MLRIEKKKERKKERKKYKSFSFRGSNLLYNLTQCIFGKLNKSSANDVSLQTLMAAMSHCITVHFLQLRVVT